MSILSKLASAQGRRDQNLNKALAAEIIAAQGAEDIALLTEQLNQGNDEHQSFDILKVLETIGETDPTLIPNTLPALIPFLAHAKNKVKWMALSAIATVAHFDLPLLEKQLTHILILMESGGVILRDKGVMILLAFYADSRYTEMAAPLLEEQLLAAPDNQFGQYSEKYLKVINREQLPRMITITIERLAELTNPSHIKRANKILKLAQKRLTTN